MKIRPSTWLYGIVKIRTQEVCCIPSLCRNSEGRILVVPIVPSRAWSQRHITEDSEEPDENVQPSLLGLSMRVCQPLIATDNVWHVLDVIEGSPAESAGLVPMGDWIIGMSFFLHNSDYSIITIRLVWRSSQRRKRLLRLGGSCEYSD